MFKSTTKTLIMLEVNETKIINNHDLQETMNKK